ncbi:MAG: hypothetical protein AAF591_01365 [Verrucomicrobiota bacterium]
MLASKRLYPLPFRSALRALALLAVAQIISSPAQTTPAAAEHPQSFESLVTTTGKEYQNVTVKDVSPSEIKITHDAGVATIPLAQLPPDLQETFNYNPDQAAAHTQQRLQANSDAARREAALLRVQKEAIDVDGKVISTTSTPDNQGNTTTPFLFKPRSALRGPSQVKTTRTKTTVPGDARNIRRFYPGGKDVPRSATITTRVTVRDEVELPDEIYIEDFPGTSPAEDDELEMKIWPIGDVSLPGTEPGQTRTLPRFTADEKKAALHYFNNPAPN